MEIVNKNNLWKYATLTLIFCLLMVAIMYPIFVRAEMVSSINGSGQTNTTERTISVTGTADVMVIPDEVIITVGIETRNSDFRKAKNENDVSAKKVIDLTKKFNIDPKYVQSDYIRTYPSYQYNKYSETSEISYYVVQKRIVITLKEIDKFEQFISELSEGGTAMIQNIEFRSTELPKFRNEARKLAVQAAKDKAKLIAQGVGCDIGKAITINEEKINNYIWYNSWWGASFSGYGQPALSLSNVVVNYMDTQDGLGAGEYGETISIGQIIITASIGIVFELK